MMQWLDFFFLPSSGDGWLSHLVPGDKESRTHSILVVGMDKRGRSAKKNRAKGFPIGPSDLIEIRNLCT